MKNAYLSLLLFITVSCSSQSVTESVIGPDEFEKGITQKDIQVLDVRTDAEFKKGHLEHALLADWTNKDQFFERVRYIDKDRPVYIYCLVGGRSAAAADWMRKNGYTSVIELKGGIHAWETAGKKIQDQAPQKQITLEEYMASIPPDKTTLVDIGADWCPPCVKMKPVINEVLDSKPGLPFISIDAGSQALLMSSLHITSIPGFIIYKNGKEVWRKEGIVPKEEFLAHLQ